MVELGVFSTLPIQLLRQPLDLFGFPVLLGPMHPDEDGTTQDRGKENG
jgi:hypothetical protein